MHSDESGRSRIQDLYINPSDPGSTAHHNSGSSRAQRTTSVNVPGVSHLNALKQLVETCYVQHPITSDMRQHPTTSYNILQHPTTSWLHNSLKQDYFLDAGIIVPNRDHPTHPVHQSPLWTEVPEHQPVTHDGFSPSGGGGGGRSCFPSILQDFAAKNSLSMAYQQELRNGQPMNSIQPLR